MFRVADAEVVRTEPNCNVRDCLMPASVDKANGKAASIRCMQADGGMEMQEEHDRTSQDKGATEIKNEKKSMKILRASRKHHTRPRRKIILNATEYLLTCECLQGRLRYAF